MYARLAFSVAIEAEADIYLMDEVLAVGDADFQTKCFKRFKEEREKGKTIILVSHDLETVKINADRVIYINQGRIEAIGDSKKVIDQYVKNF